MKKLLIGLLAITCQQVMAASSPSAVKHLASLDIALPAMIDISATHPVFDFDGDAVYPVRGLAVMVK